MLKKFLLFIITIVRLIFEIILLLFTTLLLLQIYKPSPDGWIIETKNGHWNINIRFDNTNIEEMNNVSRKIDKTGWEINNRDINIHNLGIDIEEFNRILIDSAKCLEKMLEPEELFIHSRQQFINSNVCVSNTLDLWTGLGIFCITTLVIVFFVNRLDSTTLKKIEFGCFKDY